MNKKKIIAVIFGIVCIALTVLSWILLPHDVIRQFPVGDEEPVTMAKPLAVAIPALLGIIGAGYAFFRADDREPDYKSFVTSGIGILLFGIMLYVNLILYR